MPPPSKREATRTAIDNYVADGGTALYDALYDSLAQLAKARDQRRVLVVVTDGIDENATSNGPGSLRSWDEVLDKLLQTDATVYAVGIGSRVERERLKRSPDDQEVRRISRPTSRRWPATTRRFSTSCGGGTCSGMSPRIARATADGGPSRFARANGIEIRSRGGYYAPLQ